MLIVEVHKEGDKIYIKGPEIDLEKTDRICIHALQAWRRSSKTWIIQGWKVCLFAMLGS